MAVDKVVKKLCDWKLMSTGRPKIRWENEIKEDLIIMKVNNWTKDIQAWVRWKEVVQKAKTFKQ
jgi:hypothetical protein